MKQIHSTIDAVVIGAGFYGVSIAIYLAKQRGLKRIIVLESASKILSRASYNNQARVHNGYHYPRSFTTAFRSRVNLPRFVTDFPDAIKRDFTKIYAIAKRNSKVSAKQFIRFCGSIQAEIELADSSVRQLFDSNLIAEVFAVEEYAFDSSKLTDWAEEGLKKWGIELRLESTASEISEVQDFLRVQVLGKDGAESSINTRYVFNCTYSGINQFSGDFPGVATKIKQEITEMALIEVPSSIKGMGITVMDGSFFSVMPFPPEGLHTLSHVRYTPHLHWNDTYGINPYKRLDNYHHLTQVDRMIRDASRYLPDISKSNYVKSLFEVKTILSKSESDDGRPILFERHANLPKCYSILGSKIDNIYDVLEKLDHELISV
jgi:glycine/D-amino acid oxidase-like deaminating enzyme